MTNDERPPDRASALCDSVRERWGASVGDPTLLQSGDPLLTYRGPQAALTSSVSGVSEAFALLETIGEGGMGQVFRATQPSLGREVAVKRLKDAPGQDEVAAFVAEARVTGWLDHPNVVPVHDLGLDRDGRPQLAMKLVGGSSWEALLEEGADVDHLAILRTVTHAVAFAHARGVIHRDLKPDNVMVGEFGEVLLMDWGLAAEFRGPTPAPPVTDVQALAGTPAYLAPEMAAGEGAQLGPWTDVYLLGGVLYRVLSGAPPHGGRSIWEVLAAVIEGPSLELPEDTPRELGEICLKALSAEPGDRYPDAAAFGAALDEFQAHRESREVVARAERLVRKAGRAGDESGYRHYAEAQALYRQALALWPHNRRAAAGDAEATRAYAEAALAAGDFALAETQTRALEDGRELRKAAVEGRRLERQAGARMAALRRAVVALTALALVALIGGTLWVRSSAAAARQAEATQRQELAQLDAAKQAEQARARARHTEAVGHERRGHEALARAAEASRSDAREEALVGAQGAFRAALYLEPGFAEARAGMRKASLAHFELALAQGSWQQAEEKLLQARQVAPSADDEALAARLAEAASRRQRELTARVEVLLADARRGAMRDIPHGQALRELITLRDPLTARLLLAELDSPLADLQRLVVEALGGMRDPALARALLPYIERTVGDEPTPPLTQLAAIRAICQLGSYEPEVLAAVVARYEGRTNELDPIARARDAIARYLARASEQAASAGASGSATVWLLRASVYINLGKMDEATACLDRAEQLDPRSPRLWNLRGIVLATRDVRDPAALEAFDRAVELGNDLAYVLSRGKLRQARGMLRKALTDFVRVAGSNEPRLRVSATVRAIQVMRLLEDLTSALAINDDGLRSFPDDPALLNERVLVLLAQRRPNEASRVLDRVLALAPDRPDAHVTRAVEAWSSGQHELAQHHIAAAKRLSPPNQPGPWTSQAHFYLEAGQPRKAIAEAELAMQRAPAHWPAIAAKVIGLLVLGRQQEARQQMTDGQRAAGPPPLRLQHSLGEEVEKAKLCVQGRQLGDRPLTSEAELRARCVYRISYGLLDGARRDLAQAERLAPNARWVVHERSRLALQSGDWAGYLDTLRRMRKIAPDDIGTANDLAFWLVACPDEHLRSPEQALPHAEAAMRMTQGRHPIILGTYGQVLHALGRQQEAIRALERSAQASEQHTAMGEQLRYLLAKAKRGR